MELKSGDKLGPYEILSSLGKGGMGEVWRARDSRLNREVAVKISAQQFTDRFEREAHAIASLNHPNICTLFDIGPNYLVMELIEGPTLAQQIAEGPIPVEEALAIAKQIADALEAAHDKGIVHRDLKPANIKIRPDGSVKVLDFGLAKNATEAPVTSDSPTMLSVAGMILGTAGYMAPEQARGKTVDKRADIWAFGVVLYEMVVGKRLFEGETVSDTLASVMKDDPDWTLAPARVQRLLRRCLEKDPQKRLRDISGVELLLEQVSGTEIPRGRGRPPYMWMIAASAFGLIAAAVSFIHFREKPPDSPQPVRFQIPLPANVSPLNGSFALSPDGRRLAFGAGDRHNETLLWIRDMESLEARPLEGTKGWNGTPIFWSFDSRFLVFQAAGQLKKIDTAGGPSQTICDAPVLVVGGSWNRAGVVLFGQAAGPLMRVPAAGGAPVAVTALDSSRHEFSHIFPVFLPDGKHFLYLARSNVAENTGIYAGSLDAGGKSSNRILATSFSSALTPDGRLLFVRDGALMAQSFDAGKLELTGDPEPVVKQVGTYRNTSWFSASSNGSLVYRGLFAVNSRLTWLDRQGKQVAQIGDPESYVDASLSPDGTQVALVRDGLANIDIWLIDAVRGTTTRLTFDPAVDRYPVWSPDGKNIAFASTRNGNWDLYAKSADGEGADRLLLKSNETKYPTGWSPDGRFLAYTDVNQKKAGSGICILPLTGDLRPFPFLSTEFSAGKAVFSPDGHWIAYTSDESGRNEVYVRAFPASGGGRMISRNGGSAPQWSTDGRQLIFRLGTAVMEADVSTTPAFQSGEPKLLFDPETAGGAMAPDGKRFLIPMAAPGAEPPAFTVIENWAAGLKK